MQLKRVDNLKQIYESGLADFLEKEFAGATIILFGSFSRGDDTINSDIDIAVIGRKDKLINLEQFKKMLAREIRINFYPSFKEIHLYLKSNLLFGITMFLFRILYEVILYIYLMATHDMPKMYISSAFFPTIVLHINWFYKWLIKNVF
jgi:predicted nucleotidyltransferase